jgi:hypothetical protein
MDIGTVGGRERDGAVVRSISPTDVSQFIRLDQCRRYLRLRLYERNGNSGFMDDYGVVRQSIPPILTRSGKEFEQRVERAVNARFLNYDLAKGRSSEGDANDNALLVRHAMEMGPGEVEFLFQPRLRVTLGEWRISGDVDVLRMERDEDGALHLLIVDMKSSTAARVEHRLQVAFYLEMVTALLAEADVAHDPVEIGILYRGPGEDGLTPSDLSPEIVVAQREAAERLFNVGDAFLEIVADVESYRGAVRDLVTGTGSTAESVCETAFDAVPFHLTYKCDGCLFNEFCTKWAAEHDDLSVLPHLTAEDKSALQSGGVATVRDLAALKEIAPKESGAPGYASALRTVPEREGVVRALARSWPVGPRLDELIVRARSYRRWKGDDLTSLSYIPSKGYGSLPYADAQHNPNLVRVYIDAQHDFLHDRIYLLGALVTGLEGGEPVEARRRTVVHLADEPPVRPEIEADLFVRWIRDVMRAIAEVAAPDAEGLPRAPIHLIFYNRYEQTVLLDGLARHLTTIMGATPLYDFATQIAGFDSPVVSFLDAEIRELKNYPMMCQSLQAVAAYLQFDWGTYREQFRVRVFDFWKKFDEPPREGERPWYTGRARFNSQIPLEYAYAAWHDLPKAPARGADEFASYRDATCETLAGFHGRRLEAMEHIAGDFSGNRQTEKTAFDIPDLDRFEQRAETLAAALDDFLTVERHIEMAEWRTARLAPPERRVLSGITLLARYREVDQTPEMAEANRENVRRWRLSADQTAQAGPAGLSKEQKGEAAWSQEGLEVCLDLVCDGTDCTLEAVLALSGLKEDGWVVVMPRTDVDSRLPASQQAPYTPTPKQMLYGTRAVVAGIDASRDGAGRVTGATLRLRMNRGGGSTSPRGYSFTSVPRPFEDGRIYTIDSNPNDAYGGFLAAVTEGLNAGGENTLYSRLTAYGGASVDWCDAAAEGQARFLAGLDALRAAGEGDEFEQGKRDYIAAHGDAPVLLVQGPPGTGKTYSTAFAVLARLQGAIAAGVPFRVFLTCRTHAATDVLLNKLASVRDDLHAARTRHPETFDRYIDARILDVPLFRMGRAATHAGITQLYKKGEEPQGVPRAIETILNAPYCAVGVTPGGTYRLLKDRWGKNLFGHELVDCLVLDEASQMNLPEAIMSALPLKEVGQLIVVGDHRQMPPIVKNDWASDPRRTFKEFKAYESLFLALLPLQPPMIKFAESFRLHAAMAEFLRQEIYVHDGINFHSKQHRRLAPVEHDDPFVAAVLHPDHAIVVVVHDEAHSMVRNPVEQALITPVLEALAGAKYEFDAKHGLGVVVPHTAQRAALLEAIPQLSTVDPTTGAVVARAVDTVERYQGDEREAMLFSATESDPQYLLLSSSFLLDPRRLNVALSRSKRKMVLVASRSIFTLFSTDEETFANAQLWKNLLRTTCTVKLWEGERAGTGVEVWGNI